jgi:hypothetical protein
MHGILKEIKGQLARNQKLALLFRKDWYDGLIFYIIEELKLR